MEADEGEAANEPVRGASSFSRTVRFVVPLILTIAIGIPAGSLVVLGATLPGIMLFPYIFIVGSNEAVFALMGFQLVVYGLLLGVANVKRSLLKVVGLLAVFHFVLLAGFFISSTSNPGLKSWLLQAVMMLVAVAGLFFGILWYGRRKAATAHTGTIMEFSGWIRVAVGVCGFLLIVGGYIMNLALYALR